eukprot:g64203.t1
MTAITAMTATTTMTFTSNRKCAPADILQGLQLQYDAPCFGIQAPLELSLGVSSSATADLLTDSLHKRHTVTEHSPRSIKRQRLMASSLLAKTCVGGDSVLALEPSQSVLSPIALANLKIAFMTGVPVKAEFTAKEPIPQPANGIAVAQKAQQVSAAYSIAKQLVDWSETVPSQFLTSDAAFTPPSGEASPVTPDSPNSPFSTCSDEFDALDKGGMFFDEPSLQYDDFFPKHDSENPFDLIISGENAHAKEWVAAILQPDNEFRT